MTAVTKQRDASSGDAVAGSPRLVLLNQATIGEATASALVRCARELAQIDGGGPVAAGVVDASGELLAFLRNDGAPARAINLAIMKARTSARFGMTTLSVQDALQRSGRGLVEYGDPTLTALAGGVPLTVDGQTVGGLGVSGRQPADDHHLALAVLGSCQS